jgi:hypothetical protein
MVLFQTRVAWLEPSMGVAEQWTAGQNAIEAYDACSRISRQAVRIRQPASLTAFTAPRRLQHAQSPG